MKKTFSEPTLDVLFDSPARVRLLKLFTYTPDENFDLKTIAKRLNIKKRQLDKHIKNLLKIGFINSRMFKGKKAFKTNQSFAFWSELRGLMGRASPASKTEIIRRLNKLGRIKLAVLAGVFINSSTSRADLLVVGDKVSGAKFNRFLKELEAEVGKEINYALMTTKEFRYRMDMYDRFVRDLLDFRHEKLINKLKI